MFKKENQRGQMVKQLKVSLQEDPGSGVQVLEDPGLFRPIEEFD